MNQADATKTPIALGSARQHWHPVGLVEQLRAPGDYLTCEPDGEPLVLMRNGDGELRALSRVCRHRGFDMLQGEGREGGDLRGSCGRVRRMTCPYHAWTYDLDGQLVGAPASDRMCKFDKRGVALPRFSVAVRQGVAFINLSEEPADLDAQLCAEDINPALIAQQFRASNTTPQEENPR